MAQYNSIHTGAAIDAGISAVQALEATTTDSFLVGGTGALVEKTPAEVLSLIGGISIDCLWQNASSSSEFAAQTISLDLSNYQMVLISFFRAVGDVSRESVIARKGESAVVLATARCGIGYLPHISSRVATVSNTGIEFRAAINSANLTNGVEDNNFCIPTFIYGIKGVKLT